MEYKVIMNPEDLIGKKITGINIKKDYIQIMARHSNEDFVFTHPEPKPAKETKKEGK